MIGRQLLLYITLVGKKSMSQTWVSYQDQNKRNCLTLKNQKKISCQLSLPFHYLEHKPQKNSETTILLLHGYNQQAFDLFHPWVETMNPHYHIIAPHAPFPVIERKKESEDIRLGFSWYFYHSQKDEFLITHDPAVEFLKAGLKELMIGQKLVIIGYSQGGYLAPFLAHQLTQTTQVIGLNCHFKERYLPDRANHRGDQFRLDAFHGREDKIVDGQKAHASHQQMIKKGYHGDFTFLPGTHRLSPQMIQAASEKIVF